MSESNRRTESVRDRGLSSRTDALDFPRAEVHN